ncbi:MAG: FKBP-type peptidyl-prolyl cis-trans isomerase [Duncaniella sp.]|nr:FKBP-type peptidyl-prolyl cis-trans isomerase [Duncaniella sp.]
MKKIVLACGAAAAILAVATGCSGSGSDNAAFTDSLSVAFGESNGTRLATDYNVSLSDEQKATMRKEDILRGIKQVVMTDTTQQGYLTGLSIGLGLAGQIMRFEEAGINIDRAKVYEAYAKAFVNDSISPDKVRQVEEEFQALSQKANQLMMDFYDQKAAAERKAKEEAPEAVENTKAGEEYIKKMIADDPTVTVTGSGLVYKVISEGSGEPVGEGGRAVVKYSGRLVDGTEFDSNSEGVTFSTNRVVPGFGEGLAMMKKGAHYILIIPGKLAYGIDGAPQAGIGPNATLIFDVEVVDIPK